MVKYCSAGTCKNHHLMRNEDGTIKHHFYQFPLHEKQPERRKLWARACSRTDPVTKKPWEPNPQTKHVYMCSAHFIMGRPSRDRNHPDYVPTNCTKTPVMSTIYSVKSSQRLRRFNNYAKRECNKMFPNMNRPQKKVKTSTTSLKETSNQRQVDDNESASAPVETTTNASTSTRQPVLIDEWGCYVTQKERDQSLLRQSDSTEAALNSTRLSSNTVANDDARCKFYTGVDCNVFMSTFNYLVPSLDTEGTQGTPPVPLVDQFFYTLVKLKHKNCTKFQDLSEQACVPEKTLIDHFWKWLDHMYIGLEFHKRGICWSHWCPTGCTCVRS